MKGVWKLSVIIVIVGLLSSLAGIVPSVSAAGGSDDGSVESVLVSYSGDINQMLTKSEIVHKYKIVNAVAAKLTGNRIGQLSKNPNIKIEPDSAVKIEVTELDNSWGVQQIGAGIAQTAGVDGAGVKVAIMDTGIDYIHPELVAAYKGGYDFVNNDSDPMDDNGHGTHVAGIIAAAANGVGVVGVAPDVELYAIKVLDSSGSGSWSQVIAGLDWAATNGIQIINNSYGGADYSSIVEAAFQNAWDAGILSIAAAGNSGGSATTDTDLYPARYNSVVAVAATDVNKIRASFSSTGPATEVSAPGVSINSTWLGGGYKVLSGTSMASPHAAGIAALVKSAHPDWDNTTVRGQLRATADDLGELGYDWLYGFGLVDAVAAVGTLIPNPPEMPSLTPRLMQTVANLDPTNISSTTATLNGQLTSLGSYASIRVWFAIGKVGEPMSNDTPMQQMTAPGLFSFTKTDLLPATQYWFYAIGYNGVNCVTGNQLVFATLTTPSPSPTPTPTPTPTPEPSPSPIKSVVTVNTNLQLVNNRLAFGTQALSDGVGVPNVTVCVDAVDPSGKKYNLSGTSDSSGKVSITIKGSPEPGLWQATITNVAGSYSWDKAGSATSASLMVQKAVRKK